MAKTVRVTVNADDQESELLTIRETSADDLVILIKRSDQIGDGVANKYSDTVEHRISVHVTPDQEYNTIKYHVRLENGFYRKAYSKVMPISGRIMWLCYGMSTTDLSAPRYGASTKKVNQSINLGKYSPKSGVLCYFVVVTSSPLRLRPPAEMNGITIEFNKFYLHILWIYMRSVSMHQGGLTMLAGFEELSKDGKVVRTIRMFEVSKSITRKQLWPMIREILKGFSGNHVMKVNREFYGADEKMDDDIVMSAYTYNKIPLD